MSSQPNDVHECECPANWHPQDWLLILDALDRYIWESDVKGDQEIRATELAGTIAGMHGLSPIGAVQQLDNTYFERL